MCVCMLTLRLSCMILIGIRLIIQLEKCLDLSVSESYSCLWANRDFRMWNGNYTCRPSSFNSIWNSHLAVFIGFFSCEEEKLMWLIKLTTNPTHDKSNLRLRSDVYLMICQVGFHWRPIFSLSCHRSTALHPQAEGAPSTRTSTNIS